MSEPWEKSPDSWKEVKVVSKVELLGIGVRPRVDVKFSLAVDPELRCQTLDDLKKIDRVNPKVCSAFVVESECWFRYSRTRNMWMQIKSPFENN